MTLNQTLLDLVPEHLKPLFPLEEKLIGSVTLGLMISDFPEEPIDMTQIGEAQSVRSEILIWVLTTPDVCKNIHHKGIRLRGAKILGVLDFEDSNLEYPLRLNNCIIEEKMIFDRGKYILLDFSGSQTGPINADSIQVQHHIWMKAGFKAKGEVRLLGADIGGDLECDGGEFENPDGKALFGDGLTTKGDVVLREGFKAKGEVRLPGANIGGDLACTGGEFENPGGRALSGDGLITKGAVFLSAGFKAKGEVRLLEADIGGNLECDGGEFENPGGKALNGDGLTAKGSVFLRDGFKTKGEVRLLGADIGGNLECDGGEFENPDGKALFGDGLTTKGDVFLRAGFKAKGAVRLLGADIGGDLSCRGGEFENPGGRALSGDGLTAKGSVFLREGFKSKGEVRLLGADIGVNLECDGGEFENPGGYALSGDGLTTNGSVTLRDGFKAQGEVRLPGADIGGYLVCTGGEFENPDGYALIGDNIKVGGSFVWRGLTKKPIGILSLENAHLADLDDDENSWPESGNLDIDGLVYGPLTSRVPADSKTRLRWLNLRNPNDLNVQLYEQLISVFRQMGLRDDARHVAIAKQKVIRKQLRGISRLWSWILDVTISYGYRPEKVILLFIIPIILLGSLVFYQADRVGAMEPTASQQQLPGKNLIFDPVGYSLDVFLPIVDLHQESAWEPNAGIKYGIFFQYYMYIHILAGWFFTTLAVAAVTGLVRSD